MNENRVGHIIIFKLNKIQTIQIKTFCHHLEANNLLFHYIKGVDNEKALQYQDSITDVVVVKFVHKSYGLGFDCSC